MKLLYQTGILIVVTGLSSLTYAAGVPEPQDGDRVLFMGDTSFEREGDYGHLEAHFTAAFPDRTLSFRNLAWAADTPLGRSRASFDWNQPASVWLQRVKEQVALVKPTVAFLSYGSTAALDLRETPAEAQAHQLEKFKADLMLLMDAIAAVAPQPVHFILLGPTPHGDHGGCSSACREQARTALTACNHAIAAVATARQADFLSLLDWSPRAFATRRRGMTVDGVTLTESGYAQLADYLQRQLFPARRVPSGKAYELLRAAIRKKNELFFHRWRPANWTYLFGFRKHEQGQNAREIPEFDPLIAEWETRIGGLRNLKHQDAAIVAEAQRQLLKPPREHRDPNYRQQTLPTFEIADGFEVTLWAEDPMLYKPIQMNWDDRGRLWVASSRVYPQISPGQDPGDAIIVLEDTDDDGKADQSTVFAEGLLIPTGVVPDNAGGCYVAASHQLLHFADRNQDGRADEKTIVLSSFGTEDTHHNLHTLRWGYDGHLYLQQSLYTHSHLETPYGVRRLNSGGIWRFNPDTWHLEVFLKGPCNPWGHHWDQAGNDFFTDGAGFKGIYHALEGATYFTYTDMRREAESITPGAWPKFCSLELIRGGGFPADWQGDAITCDFRAHRVVRFKLNENGATFHGKEMPDLLRSTNVTFRPIDLRMGPDGALYVADWANPIIQHGEVDFRDPRRDHEHGRIWRVTAKNHRPAPPADLSKLRLEPLLDRTLSDNGWEQEQARRRAALTLKTLRPATATQKLSQWWRGQNAARAPLEALWLTEAAALTDPQLVQVLATADNADFRAAAARHLANHPTTGNASNLLVALVHDPSPRVRREALRALARIPTARSAELALGVLNQPMDPTLDYALWLTINDLAEPWIAALASGAWSPDGREKQLEFGLQALPAAQTSRVLGQLLASRPLTRDGRGPWIEIIGAAGTPNELRQLFDQVLSHGFGTPATLRALHALGEAFRLREQKPAGSLTEIHRLLDEPEEAIQLAALQLGGAWQALGGQENRLGQMAGQSATSPALRTAAFKALRQLGQSATPALLTLTAQDQPADVRRAAAAALAAIDLKAALPRILEMAATISDEATALALWRELLTNKGAAAALRAALPGVHLPSAVATAGTKAAREGGRNDVELAAAFATAGGLSLDTAALNDAAIRELAAQAAAQGNPHRGEMIYRRPDLACMTCHAIGGAGGQVGPDLTSIGASAPLDYLVESLVLPSARIKEGYAAVNIDTTDGQSLTGTLARETPEEVVLRNLQNAEVHIAKRNIEHRQNGTLSLMPSGLLDPLSAAEQADLIAFLAQLGKPGDFDASPGGVARRWCIYPVLPTDQQNNQSGRMWTAPLTDKMWWPAYTLTDGRLNQDALVAAHQKQKWAGLLEVVAAVDLTLPQAGKVTFQLQAGAGELWVDSRRIGGPGQSIADLSAGVHRVLVRINPQHLPATLSLRASDGTFRLN